VYRTRAALTAVDRLLQAPGALYELEQRVIFGREQRVWKNVSEG
jgi:hypothetical protein